ncbi:MAG: hypothetical protein M3004_03115 [Bacteroidota bacterium]|nr:hypothetical protein [Bacteroidota bacterium]
MKRLLISACMLFSILIATRTIAQEKVKEKDDKTKVKDKDDNYKEKDKANKIKIKDDNGKIKIKNGKGMMNNYPYTAAYSSNFIMGNPAHAKMVLDMWKDYDDNQFTRHDMLADTVKVYLPDGTVISGKQNSLSGLSAYRSGFASATSTVDAWMPLKSVDRNENWVAIWGSEKDTNKDGSVTSTEIHEIWRINKDGKVDYIKQYAGKTPAAQ